MKKTLGLFEKSITFFVEYTRKLSEGFEKVASSLQETFESFWDGLSPITPVKTDPSALNDYYNQLDALFADIPMERDLKKLQTSTSDAYKILYAAVDSLSETGSNAIRGLNELQDGLNDISLSMDQLWIDLLEADAAIEAAGDGAELTEEFKSKFDANVDELKKKCDRLLTEQKKQSTEGDMDKDTMKRLERWSKTVKMVTDAALDVAAVEKKA